MNLSRILRAEIDRRGLSVTAVSEGAKVPFSTVSEFLRDRRQIGLEKASKIATFLGFDLVISRIRRKEMSDYEALVDDLKNRGISVDDDTMENTEGFVQNLRIIRELFGYTDGFAEEDVEMAEKLVGSLIWLKDQGWGDWSEEDAKMAETFVGNLQWLRDQGWEAWSEEDAETVAGFAADLIQLAEAGEEPTTERIEEVAEFIDNLEKLKRSKKS